MPKKRESFDAGFAQRFRTALERRFGTAFGSHAACARALGIRPTAVSELLAGSIPGYRLLRRIKRELGVSLDWLLEGEIPSERRLAELLPDVQEAVRRLEALPLEAREQVNA
jgi:transcriptional regulator with XRE-family HTH domain